ncbi:MAG: hypothetical protein NTU97_02445, partial [Candidatus Magasanikbacteria bacterium]|nr:hypothetical protein [Candidatus Magasanikbacteria bacterium]
ATIQIYKNATKQITKIINERIKTWQNIFLQKDNTLLIVGGDNTLTQFDQEKETFEFKEAVWPARENKMDLAVTYNTKLYSLDKKSNQIFKHPPTTTGFGKGVAWLKTNQGIDLTDVTSMAIDGNIYVAKQNGQIYKLESGFLSTFEINFLDPVLINVTKIYTKNGSDNFFVLDKEKKRVIIWNKTTNKLVTQLTNPNWDNLKDFSIDEKERKIYLLNGSTIQSTKY